MEDLKISIENRLTYFIDSLNNYSEDELNNINENLDVLLNSYDKSGKINLHSALNISFPLDISKESDTLTKECIEALFLGYMIKKLLI